MTPEQAKRRAELRAEIAERKRIESLPENVGWVRKYERNTHLNNQVERDAQSGHRVPKLPSLDDLDRRGSDD